MAPKRNAVSYTDAELEAMMIDLESDLVERKESAQDGRKIRRNICAFANDLPANGRPGVLLVGVGDDGSCASLTVDDALLTALANVAGEGLILPLLPKSWPTSASRSALALAFPLPRKRSARMEIRRRSFASSSSW